jgi:hypothetical protein
MADHESDLGPDAPPTEDELREARALAEALESTTASEGGPSHRADDAAFLHAVALAEGTHVADLDPEKNARLVERALARAAANVPEKRREGRVIRVTFGAVTALSLAAAVMFAIVKAPPSEPSPALAMSRSTQELFREPFHGEASARIDRIAMARSSELRENRFARWGVR